MFKDFNCFVKLLVELFCDNRVVIYIDFNFMFYERIKYIEVDCYFVRDKVLDGFIVFIFVSIKN